MKTSLKLSAVAMLVALFATTACDGQKDTATTETTTETAAPAATETAAPATTEAAAPAATDAAAPAATEAAAPANNATTTN